MSIEEHWVTINGHHVLIKNEPSSDEALKSRQIEASRKQAEEKQTVEKRVANTTAMVEALNKSGVKLDSEYAKCLISVAQSMHDKYPEIDELTKVTFKSPQEMGDALASMNGFGWLELRSDVLSNFERANEYSRALCARHWLAGGPSFGENVLPHELAHNLDMKFGALLQHHAPTTFQPSEVVRNDLYAEAYSKTFGREIKTGDTVSDIPTADYDVKFFEIDGVKYSLHDLPGRYFSDFIVPMAIKNVQEHWSELGYSYEPEWYQLVQELSGYVYREYDMDDKSFSTEVFAESYANCASYGEDANVLAREVMRLFDQAYRSVTSRPLNDMTKWWSKFFKVTAEIRARRKEE